MDKEKYIKKCKKEYDEINKILDENDKEREIENNKIIKKRDLVRVKYDPLNNWKTITSTKEEIKKLKQKSMQEIINEYAKE